MNICKIFEQEKNYSLNSIPAILNLIKNNNINPKYPKYIDEFLSKYDTIQNKGNYIDTLMTICEDFYSKHRVSFKKYDYTRDKVIAHSEYQAQKNSLPSHKIMKEILLFGIDFYYMINRAFLDVGPHPIHDDKQIFSSLYSLLEKLGCESIKTKFDK
jgi:hypothetical protein